MRGLVFAFLFSTGCVSTTAQFTPTIVGQILPTRTAPESVELFRSQSPAKKYSEIGAVSICCGVGIEKSVELMRKTASNNGGDAIIGLDSAANGLVMATVIRYQ